MEMSKNKRVIVITGPTAVGKTAVAIELAKLFKTEIISADSRQCYKELNIGVARPTEKELNTVKHHFIASHSIQEDLTAVSFEQYSLKKVEELFKEHDDVILVGGTGLYIKAFCEGLDIIPDVDPAIRKRVVVAFENNGLRWLQEQLKEKDPSFYSTGEIKNPQRMMRALEVFESTGNSILYYRKGNKVKRDFSIVKVGLELPREELIERINRRVDLMIHHGLVEEVKQLLPYKYLNALQTVGYQELIDYMERKCSLEEAIERIKINSRQYAKRQLTWFKKDKEIEWFAPGEIKEIIKYIS